MNRIPLLDMKAQLEPIREEIDNAVSRVIDSGGFILGKEVSAFEDEICEYTGSSYAIGVSNGTDAISLAIESLGIGKGDKVISPAFTYYATAGAIVHAGAEPLFVDIDPKTYCISPKALREALRDKKHKDQNQIKAVIPVHLYGQCADMDKIAEAAKEYGLKIIEDVAQGFGALYCNKKAGTFGDAATVSFFPGKNLGACGDAGIVLTNDSKIDAFVRRLRNQGADPDDKYKHILLGHNNRLDAIQAAILRVKLRYMDKWNQKRQDNADYYNEKLKGIGLVTPHLNDNSTHTFHQYILRAGDSNERDRMVRALNGNEVDSRVYYPDPLHLQPCFKYLGYKKGDFPESEAASETVFAIPVYPELTKEQMDYIIETIKRVKG